MNLKPFLAILALASLNSCKDKCDKDSPGLSGNVTLEGHVKHHSAAIPNSRVYIKFGASEFPGADTTLYDAGTSANSTDAHYSISGLSPGDYYLYGVGYDPSLQDSVFGGIGIEICEDGGTVETNVPVTE